MKPKIATGALTKVADPFYQKPKTYPYADRERLPISVVLSAIETRAWFTEQFVVPLLEANQPTEILVVDDPELSVQQKRNAGLRMATQDYVFFCDDDTLLPAQHLRRVLMTLEDHGPSVAFAYSDYQAIDLNPETHPKKGNYYFRSQEFDGSKLRRGNFISTMS